MGKKVIGGMAVDIETTGLIDGVHDIIQISLVQHDESFEPTGLFFRSNVRPINPKMADAQALEINGLSLKELEKAPTVSQVRSMLLEWKEELFGDGIFIPLGQNFDGFDKPFLKKWLNDLYSNVFYYHARDSWTIADICRSLGLIKLESLSLSSMKEYFGITSKSHDSYYDSVASLKIYKKCLELLKGAK